MKRYCPHCGFGTNYVSVKPTSCAKCKKGLDLVIVPQPAVAARFEPVQTPRRRPAPEPEPVDDDFDIGFDVDLGDNPFLENEAPVFEVRGHSPRKVTIGEVASSAGSSDRIRDIPKKIDRRSVIDSMLPNRKVKPARQTAKPAPRRTTRGVGKKR